jgi:hypothetical protein
LEFRTKSVWKNHFQCQYGSENFDIYGHKGRKFSVYKNDRQVAWWDKQAVSWFEGDNYKLIADVDSDYELIMAFCLIIDNHLSNSNEGNTVTFDLGNIGPQAKAFDSTWLPNYYVETQPLKLYCRHAGQGLYLNTKPIIND